MKSFDIIIEKKRKKSQCISITDKTVSRLDRHNKYLVEIVESAKIVGNGLLIANKGTLGNTIPQNHRAAIIIF